MKSEVRETGPLKRELEVILEVEEVRSFIDAMVNSFRSRYNFPGFRPGKAPAKHVLSKFHEEIDKSVVEELVPDSIRRAMMENKIHPAGPGELISLKYEPDQPLVIQVAVEIWPEFDLAKYDDMEVEQAIEETESSEIDKQINWMQDRLATYNPVERAAAKGDILEIELLMIDEKGEALTDAKSEPASIEVGAQNLLREFDEAALGAEKGAEKTIEVKYPEDFSNEELRGQTRYYRMDVKSIQEKVLPPVDDELAKKIDPSLDLDGLKAKINLRLESEKRMASRQRLEQTIVDRLLHENPFDLPKSTVDLALKRLGEKAKEEEKEISPEELDTTYRPHVERAHRRELILSKVGEREGVSVTQKDIDEEIAKMAENENRSTDEVMKDIGEMDRFRDFLFERRVFEVLIGKLKISEVKIPSPAADLQE